jgi:hypothetical protein
LLWTLTQKFVTDFGFGFRQDMEIGRFWRTTTGIGRCSATSPIKTDSKADFHVANPGANCIFISLTLELFTELSFPNSTAFARRGRTRIEDRFTTRDFDHVKSEMSRN